MGMRRSGVVGVVLGVVLLGLGLSAASASATGLLSLRANGTPLAAGAPLTLASGNLSLTFDRNGSDSCTKSTLDGVLEWNGKPKDAVSIPESAFSGGDPLNEELCKSTDHFETSATFEKLNLLPTGKAELKLPVFTLNPPPPHTSNNGTCHFHAPAIHGTFPVSTSEPGTPITVTFHVTLKIVPDSGGECGTAAILNAAFEVTSEGAPVVGVVVP
jgi:hypothetical protein